jgi:dTDP-glucose 4,6-dehydratase
MNIYGPKQHPEKFIPLVINKVLNDEEVHIHSNKELTEAGKRHYLYSEDVSKAIMFLLSNHTIGEKYNIVANEETDNLDLARRLADIIGKPLKYKLVDPTKTRPRFDFRYAMCGKKMHDMGWSQEISLTDGLAMTVDWYIKQFEIHTKNSMQSM